MKINICFISLIILLKSIFITEHYCSGEDKVGQITMYVAQAEALLKARRADEALSAIKMALKIDKKNAPANHVLSKIYYEFKTPETMTQAEKAIREAIKYDTGNPEYHIFLARVLIAQGFKENAVRYLESVIEQFPENAEMLYLLAQLQQESFTRIQYVVSGDQRSVLNDLILKSMQEKGEDVFREMYDRDLTGQVLDFTKFADQRLEKVRITYQKLMKIDSTYQDTDFQMAQLAYRTEDWNEMIRLSHHWIRRNPDDANGYLTMGLGYLRAAEYAKADSAFKEFKKRIDPADWGEQFDYFDQFLPNDQQQKMQNMMSYERKEFRENFWKSRDPLYLTTYNERILEHYGRIAEANLLFSYPKLKIDGWKTDRGRVWICYGPPVKRIKNLNITEEESVRSKLSRNKSLESEDMYEFWYYNKFVLLFYEFPLWSGIVRFADSRYWSSTRLFEQLQKKTPDAYQMKVQGKQIVFPYYAVDFRGEKGKTRLEIFYEFPVNGFVHKEENGKFVARAKQGTILFNEYWNEVERNEQELEHTSPVNVDSTNRDNLVKQNRFEVLPGQYHLAIEVMDNNSQNVGAAHTPLDVEKYSYDSLQVSDLLLAKNIEPTTSPKMITIDNIRYTPSIDQTFKKPQNIFLYFEIYNLQITGVPGESKYQLEYGIQYKKSPADKEWSVGKVLGRLFSFTKNKFELATTAQYTGSNPVENMYIEIDPSSLNLGMYQLTLKVTDQLAHKITEKKTIFYLRE